MNIEQLSFNILVTSFKLEIEHLEVIFFLWCFDVRFEFYNRVLIQMYIFLELYNLAA